MKFLKIIFISVISLILLYFLSDFFSFKTASPVTPGQKAIIVGATSGIGQALAYELADRGYILGITGRREDRLQKIAHEIGSDAYVRTMDVTKPEQAQEILQDLIKEMGGMDVIIISAGVGSTDFTWKSQKPTLQTNVVGFTAIAMAATDYFIEQKAGHLVGISSIAAIRGVAAAPLYAASKAFESHYFQGLRARLERMDLNITVTTIEPGLVDTAMGQASDFWRATPQKAAAQIADAIDQKKSHAYVTKRWRLLAWFCKWCPNWLFYKIF